MTEQDKNKGEAVMNERETETEKKIEIEKEEKEKGPALLRIEGLRKSFGKTEVLKGVDFSVHQKEIISVLGPSGCGKSTLLNIIAGLLAPDAGRVTVNGSVVSDKNQVLPPERRRMNMVFQGFALWPHLTAYENIVYGLRRGRRAQRLSETEIRKKAETLLELLHLQGYERRYPAELSGGQQQRVAIARALITEPEILLMDEPLCNLDVQLRVEMRTEMAFLFRRLGTTVFHVTHDPSEAFAMADRIIVMNEGCIDQIDTPQNCYRHPATESVAALLGAGNRLHAQKAGPDSVLLCGRLLRAQLEPAAHAAAAASSEVSAFTSAVASSSSAGASAFASEAGVKPIYDRKPSAGTQVILRFRAESAAWLGENEPNGEDAQQNCFSVQVEYASFEGDVYRVRAVTEAGEELNFLSRTDLKKGTTGFVGIGAEHLYAYES